MDEAAHIQRQGASAPFGDGPLSVMEAAHAGDAIAMEQVLRYYECYINKLCTRTLYDSNGIPYVCVDEYMKRRLEIKLIHSIVKQEI